MREVVLGIVCRRGRVLLVKRRKEDDFVWSLPGGTIQGGETREYAIIRKIRQESGIDCVAVREIGVRQHPSTSTVVRYWECRYHAGILRPQASFVEAAEWVDPTVALERLGTSLFEPAAQFLSQVTRPGI